MGFRELRCFPFFDPSPHVQDRSNSTTTMPPKKMNRFPLCTSNECGSVETIWASIRHGTPSLVSQNTPVERHSPSVLPQAEIDHNSDQECPIDDETDDCETDNDVNDPDEDVDPRAPFRPNIILPNVVEHPQATVERLQRMIEFLLQQNSELLSQRESTSMKIIFDMTYPR